MTIEEIKEKLKCFDDPEFTFEPEEHVYHYHGKPYVSATTFLGNFHEEFNSDFWSKKKAEQRGVDQSVILAEWQELNDYANEVGHATHEYIENYYNRVYQELPMNPDVIDRINKFNVIYPTHMSKLEPIVMEKKIFSKKYPIAGTIDALFYHNGKIVIVDYKTNKKFTTDEDNRWNYLLEPFDDYYQNHLNEYSIQISLYAYILKEWGFDVAGGYLLYIGPDRPAEFHRAHNFIEILDGYLPQHNFEQLV
jgi:ATP-dependent exoDNAse (exonuclease V) beta subunit